MLPIHTHPHPYSSLLSLLQSHLPYSGPLLRRIQYQVSHPSPTAHILTTFPESAAPPQQQEKEQEDDDDDEPWLAAYVDIHKGPETQVWLFSSLETQSPSPVPNPDLQPGHYAMGRFATSTTHNKTTKNQLLSLFSFIRKTLIPPYIQWRTSHPPQTTTTTTTNAKNEKDGEKIKPHPQTSFLLGTIHLGLVNLIIDLTKTQTQTQHPSLRILRGQNTYYVKYCFPISSVQDPENKMERGRERERGIGYVNDIFRFSDSAGNCGLQGHQVDLVLSRTHIRRSRGSLLEMGSVVLYDSSSSSSSSAGTGTGTENANGNGNGSTQREREMPIAWAFLGFDGSLSTLHVEPEYRGRGLAVLVGREVMKTGREVFGRLSGVPRGGGLDEEGKEWFFADVAVENVASRRVMEKMGGFVGWTDAWVVVDVDV